MSSDTERRAVLSAIAEPLVGVDFGKHIIFVASVNDILHLSTFFILCILSMVAFLWSFTACISVHIEQGLLTFRTSRQKGTRFQCRRCQRCRCIVSVQTKFADSVQFNALKNYGRRCLTA